VTRRGGGIAAVASAALSVFTGIAFTLWWLNSDWIAHDEGVLGQSASWVLDGLVPHRDFAEPYTGLLSWWHALAFRLLGVSVTSTRMAAMAIFVPTLVASWRLASTFLPAAGASLVTLLVAAWGLATYPAAMPSWYGLFLSLIAAERMVAWRRDGRTSALVMAAFIAGLSVLVKITGLWTLTGLGLSCLVPRTEAADRNVARVPAAVWRQVPAVVGIAVSAYAAVGVVLRRGDATTVVTLGTPIVVTAVVMATVVWRWGDADARAAWRALLIFATVSLLPSAAFAGAYAATGALDALVFGLFVAPFRRVADAAWPMPTLTLGWPALLVAVALWRPVPPEARRRVALVVGLAAIGWTWWIGDWNVYYARTLLAAMRPLLSPGGILLVTVPASPTAWTRHDDLNEHRRRYTAAMLAGHAAQAWLEVAWMGPFFHWLWAAKVAVAALERVRVSEPRVPRVPPAPLNAVLRLASRADWRLGGALRLPIGSSLVAVLRAAR
jgi:hypothetical protein